MKFRGHTIVAARVPGVVNSGFDIRNDEGLAHESVPTLEEAIEQVIHDTRVTNSLAVRWREWKTARSEFCALPAGAPEIRAALNRLSNAEDALNRVEDVE